MSVEREEREERIAGGPVWPASQTIRHHGNEQTVLATRFEDWRDYHPGLLAALDAFHRSEAAPFKRRYIAAFGGTKIESPEQWNVPEADLICRRAIAFCTTALPIATAQTLEGWANIYGKGDYAMAHSHPDASASLLYVVDTGREDDEVESRDPLAGMFAIVDPRYGACCERMDGYVTNPVMPKLLPGTMLLFPGWLVHAVNPHRGNRSRITLTWNVRTTASPARDPRN